MSELIRYRVEGALARITLARPPLNILTTEMLLELERALCRAEEDAEIRLVRLDAEGKLFSAGVDVADHVGERIAPMINALLRLFLRFDSLLKPSVAVVHGAALGGGMELTLATDLCFASEAASFGQPEVRLGLFPPPAAVLLPRLVGERRALGLLLSGEAIPAAAAKEAGLVNEVFPAERLEPEVGSRLARLFELSGSALFQNCRAVRAARDLPVAAGHRELARIYIEELMRTADAREGLLAFTERRPPRWKHG